MIGKDLQKMTRGGLFAEIARQETIREMACKALVELSAERSRRNCPFKVGDLVEKLDGPRRRFKILRFVGGYDWVDDGWEARAVSIRKDGTKGSEFGLSVYDKLAKVK